MLAGLLLLEALSIVLFALLLIGKQARDLHMRTMERLAYESDSLALQAREALLEQRPGWVGLSAKMMTDAPDVAIAKITDPVGNVLFAGTGSSDEIELSPIERAQIPRITKDQSRVFSLGGSNLESAAPIYTGNDLRGFVWVQADPNWGHARLKDIFHGTILFAVIWMIASIVLVLLMARSITRPLEVLHRGATALMTSEGVGSQFPLPVTVSNEIGDLIENFNGMVASLAEQRAGLNDTLSLLDSMLANAPIGLAFVDRSMRFVRVNQVFAGLTGAAVSGHLGRAVHDILPRPAAGEIEAAVARVFTGEEEAVRNLELSGEGGKLKRPWSWLISAYPVRTTPNQVRWVGIIALDASDRKRSEEALRRSEKLAVTGRLAASIAHEINNPLEAITNLLFLLRNFVDLPEGAAQYTAMAEHEVRRISEITQQTLRFYRQPTQPARAPLSDLIDSVLSLYQNRMNVVNLRVERDYDREMSLFCFAGEIRQVFANVVGNAIDASSPGGRLLVRARRSRGWKNPSQTGIRFTVADTGAGIDPEARDHIFEAFFTTKEVTGTGLGLWVSHEIILKHHGSVRVRSRVAGDDGVSPEKSSGTVFEIFIPDDESLNARGNADLAGASHAISKAGS